jgi:hypothetical protein
VPPKILALAFRRALFEAAGQLLAYRAAIDVVAKGGQSPGMFLPLSFPNYSEKLPFRPPPSRRGIISVRGK